MEKTKSNMHIGYEYALLHLCIECICFHTIYLCFTGQNGAVVYIFALIYDFLAFVPQFIFGGFLDKHTRFPWDYVGVACLALAVLLINFTDQKWSVLILITMGNAILHEVGAVVTTSVSGGKMSHSSIFVSGGSFGLIIGTHLGMDKVSILFELICVAIILAVVVKNQGLLRNPERCTPKYDLVMKPDKVNLIVLVALCVVAVRSYIGYAIPISWKKELWQAYVLFFSMGFGKALGGIFIDRFGARRVAVSSTLLCIPFLLAGDNFMIISIVGVFLFSMTMSITLGMLLSVLPEQPGLAFGITTVALFLGTLPVFLVHFSKLVNMVLVVVLSLGCAAVLRKTLK